MVRAGRPQAGRCTCIGLGFHETEDVLSHTSVLILTAYDCFNTTTSHTHRNGMGGSIGPVQQIILPRLEGVASH